MRKNSVYFLLILLFSGFFISTLQARIKMPGIFSDNMMLQRDTIVKIWGWSNASRDIMLSTSWNQKKYSSRADFSGRWELKIATPKEPGPFSITISDGEPVIIKNVLIGEVWICSGQSNMEMSFSGVAGPVDGALDAVVKSKSNKIRLFTLKHVAKIIPQEDCEGIWVEATPESVYNFSAAGYFFGRLVNDVTGLPVGLIHTSWGGSKIEAWMSPASLEGTNKPLPVEGVDMKMPMWVPAALYNGMINPIIGYGIRGVLWYQGESNQDEPNEYALLFKRMIKDWRELWDQGEFPFYYVQIAPFRYGGNSAFLREVQLKAEDSIPNIAMVVNMDANSPDNIHPSSKKQVGERLACLALSKTYGIKGFPCSSPVYRSMKTRGSNVELEFDLKGSFGIFANVSQIKGFKIAGQDKRFHDAFAYISGNRIFVSSPQVEIPVAVRFAFDNTSASEIFNMEGLPVSSFRTDNWEK
jgi:sialate O-acetylesterase